MTPDPEKLTSTPLLAMVDNAMHQGGGPENITFIPVQRTVLAAMKEKGPIQVTVEVVEEEGRPR